MRTNFVIVLLFSFFFISCDKKDINKSSYDLQSNEKILNFDKNKNIELDEVISAPEIMENKEQIKIEQAMKNFHPAIEFINEYKFSPIADFELKLLNFYLNDEKLITCSYNNQVLCLIKDITGNIERIYNNCIPFRDNRLYSASFNFKINEIYYYGVINLLEGKIKLYKSLQSDYQFSIPYYSGKDSYFIINNVRIINPSFYDYKTYSNVEATYGGYIEIYNFMTNKLEYRIDKRDLHENVLYDIDKIRYEKDGFRVIIGNCYDSDEYTDFKIYTANNDFHYEIYDKYIYSDYINEE